MAKAVRKIALSRWRDIPFVKLVLGQADVRKIKANVSVEELAEDIVGASCRASMYVLSSIPKARKPACSKCRRAAAATRRRPSR